MLAVVARRLGLFFVLSFAAAASPQRSGAADAPALDAFFPAGGERGTTNVVTAVGKFDAWPPKIWVSETGVVFSAETNKGKLTAIIARDARPGPRLVRLHNEQGTSEPRIFVVGDGKEISESEPNNHFAKAQIVTDLPLTINGRLDKNDDVDSFALNVRAGEWIEARVDAYTLMSKVDAVLRLVSTNGQQLAWNHDFTTLDPRLLWRSERDENVVLQLFGFAYPPASEIRMTGGDAIVYRLHMDLTNDAPRLCAPPTEVEPNNTTAEAQRIDLPAAINGSIAASEDEDRFQFAVSKNEFIEARIEAAAFGSPLDAWMKIEDQDGKQLARSDDVDGSPDPYLEWKSPANGTFVVAIGSVTHRGGENFCYRLSVQRAGPEFHATLPAASLVLTVGATNQLKLNLKRLRGHTNDLALVCHDLPAGVMLERTNFPPKDAPTSARAARRETQAEPTVQFIAATNAAAFQGPVRLLLVDLQTREQRSIPFELITRGETGFGHLLVETNDQLWLTVLAKKSPAPPPVK